MPCLHKGNSRRIASMTTDPRDAEIARDAKRFWEKVDVRGPDECWPWLSTKDRKAGRGRFYLHGRNRVAPAVALELSGKPMPSDRTFACHSCDNPNCVNPRHLWWGDVRMNGQDAAQKGRLYGQDRTHCIKGHELSGDNLQINSQGRRRCATCQKRHQLKYQSDPAIVKRRNDQQNERRRLKRCLMNSI